MELRWEPFGVGLDDELLIGRPMEPFEVDGITYTPPWMRDTDLPVHYAPMFDLKEEFYFEDYF